MGVGERQSTLSLTAAGLRSLTPTVVQNAIDSTDRHVFSDYCCGRRSLVDQCATRAFGRANATSTHRARPRTHSQGLAADGRYGFLSLGAAHRLASAGEPVLAGREIDQRRPPPTDPYSLSSGSPLGPLLGRGAAVQLSSVVNVRELREQGVFRTSS
jgi:hypothetical protein